MDKIVKTRRERFWNREAWVRDEWVKREAAKLPPGSRVLDAGAGASKYRPFFSHCQYRTQDFCQYSGPLVQYLQPIDYVCDVAKIPLPDASLDAVLCTEVLEHVTDPMAALREFARLLRPGGRLLLTAPQTSQIHMEPYHYYGGFTHYWYRHWLPACGFKVEEVSMQGGPGRAVLAFMQAYYMSWREREHNLRGLRRLFPFFVRMLVKVPLQCVLSRLLTRFDALFEQPRLCVGLMVSGTRAGPDSSSK
jgi:SAM-dependent methyltransferase